MMTRVTKSPLKEKKTASAPDVDPDPLGLSLSRLKPWRISFQGVHFLIPCDLYLLQHWTGWGSMREQI